MSNEANAILSKVLTRLQQNVLIRKGLALALLLVLLGLAAHFVYEMLPRQYNLRITGGDLLSNRHFLAKILQDEARSHGVNLQLRPMAGSQEALEQIDQGRLDLAFIQGGLVNNYHDVVHVATVAPELLHFLVRPGMNKITDLRGKRVNLGGKKGGTRIIAKQVLEFSGLIEGIDYVESNISAEDLLSLQPNKLPEAVVITSFAPSDVVDFLVKHRGYELLEIPFPESLAQRLGWVANSKVLAYMYNVNPAVPPTDIHTVGVNLHLVANRNVDPRAIFQVLESLFNPAMDARLRMKLDEATLATPSGFPLSEGTKRFLERKNPLLSSDTLDQIKALFGLVLSVMSTILVVYKWFRGEPIEAEKITDDAFFVERLEQVARMHRDLAPAQTETSAKTPSLHDLHAELSVLRADVLAKTGHAKLDNPHLPNTLLLAISELAAQLHRLETPHLS